MSQNNVHVFPELETERLSLRELHTDDREAIFQLFSDAEVLKYLGREPWSNIEDAMRELAWYMQCFKAQKGVCWGITFKRSVNLVGICAFESWNKRDRVGVLACYLSKPYWNQGITTEAVQALVDYGFKKMHLNRIEARIDTRNLAASHMLRKVGFQAEVVHRERKYWNGAFHDIGVFSFLQSDRYE